MRTAQAFTYFLLYTALANASLAAAEVPCPSARLDQGGSMKNLAVLDQEDFGDCFAAGVAQAWEAYRFSHGAHDNGDRISPLSLGVGVAQSFEGLGNIRDVVTDLGRHPTVCTEAAMQRILNHATPASFIKDLRTALAEYDRVSKLKKTLIAWYGPDFQAKLNPDFMRSLAHEYGDPALDHTRVADEIACRLSEHRPDSGTSLQGLQKLVLAQEVESVQQELARMADLLRLACGKDVVWLAPLPLAEYLVDTSSPLRERESAIAPLLNRFLTEENAQPVMIDYCADFIHGDPKHEGYRSASDKCFSHVSVLIGQRFRAGKCEVLLRNSWGPNWCPPTPKGHPSECEGGQVWIDREQMSRQIIELSSFSNLPQEPSRWIYRPYIPASSTRARE